MSPRARVTRKGQVPRTTMVVLGVLDGFFTERAREYADLEESCRKEGDTFAQAQNESDKKRILFARDSVRNCLRWDRTREALARAARVAGRGR